MIEGPLSKKRGAARLSSPQSSSAIPYSNCSANPLKNFIEQNDPAVWRAIADEMQRQQDGLELIASENYTSPAVMQAAGTVLTNKYAEGYPGKRYYGGCEFVDVVEQLAIDRAKELFGAEFANVQPHMRARRRTRRSISRRSSRATRCSDSTWPTAGI